MIAYRIDADFSISRVDDAEAEMKARGWDWSCLDYDDTHDVWSNDWGLVEVDYTLAWIGRARRITLPAYIRGADGEDSCEPTIAIGDVRFGKECNQSQYQFPTEPDGRQVLGLDPNDVIVNEHDRG